MSVWAPRTTSCWSTATVGLELPQTAPIVHLLLAVRWPSSSNLYNEDRASKWVTEFLQTLGIPKAKQRFCATVCKTVRSTTVRPMLSDRSPVLTCLSVTLVYCGVGVLWPNGWTDQDETWRAGRPRPWPYCVRWGPSYPSPKGARLHQFSVHICCGQKAAWMKMPLGLEVGLGLGDFVLDGNPVPLPKKGAEAPDKKFRPMFIVAKRLDGSRGYLARR